MDNQNQDEQDDAVPTGGSKTFVPPRTARHGSGHIHDDTVRVFISHDGQLCFGVVTNRSGTSVRPGLWRITLRK